MGLNPGAGKRFSAEDHSNQKFAASKSEICDGTCFAFHPADDRIKKNSDLVGENVTGELPATAAMA